MTARKVRRRSVGIFLTGSITSKGKRAAWTARFKLPADGSGGEDIMLRAEGEARDVFRAIFRHDKDIVLTVATGARHAVRDGQHRLHGDHHTRLENGIDVLAQFHTSFTAVIVGQHAKGMAVAERAIAEKTILPIDLVQLRCHVTAARAGFQQLEATPMDGAIDLPDAQVLVAGMIKE